MPIKSIFRLIALFLVTLVITTCASGGGARGLTVEPTDTNADIEVFPQIGHNDTVNSIAYTQNGKQIITVSDDNTAKLWDIATGRLIRTFYHTSSVDHVIVSSDGKIFATIGTSLSLWDIDNGGKQLYTFPIDGHCNDAAFSPDGTMIVSANWDRTVKIWDVSTRKIIKSLSGHSSEVKAVAFSPSGKSIASMAEGTIKIWDTSTENEVSSLLPRFSNIISVAFSPNGKNVISLSCNGSNGMIEIWDASSGQQIHTFPIQGIFWEVQVRYSPDGRYVASGPQVWDVTTGREILHLNNITGKEIRGYDIRAFTTFSPDSRRVVFVHNDANSTTRIVEVDITSGKETNNITFVLSIGKSLVFSSDWKTFITVNRGSSSTLSSGGRVYLYDYLSGQRIHTLSNSVRYVTDVAFNPDGTQILSDNYLYDIVTGRMTAVFKRNEFYVSTKSGISSEELYEIFRQNRRQIGAKGIFWDAGSGQVSGIISARDPRFQRTHISPDGKRIADLRRLNDQDTLTLYEVNSGQPREQIITKLWDVTYSHTSMTSMGQIAFSPDGKHIIIEVQTQNSLFQHDVETGQLVRTFTGLPTDMSNPFKPKIESMAFSPNGKYFAVGDNRNRVKVWVFSGGQELRIIELDGDYSFSTIVLHGTASIDFNPMDGNQIAIGMKDGTLRLWDIIAGKEIRRFLGHTLEVTSVAFSPNGKQLISGSQDCTTRLWDVATGKELARFINFSGEDSQLAAATRGLTVTAKTVATSNEGEWLSITPDGYYQSSPRGDRYLNVREGNTVSGIDSYHDIFYNPDVVQARLQGRPDPASKAKVTIQQAASFKPPAVTIQSPANFSTTSTATANLSVNIIDQNQPLKNIKVFVNGRSAGKNQLAAIKGSGLKAEQTTITVTGNQKTASFTMPLELDPGDNRIEVVASNSYGADTRRSVSITYNAPSGTRPALPNLWILAVGVNNYQDTNIANLNFCVADAKGVIASLKAQEGRRYGKVNALLIADGEAVAPTAANIKQNLSFLDQAGDRDVVLFFLAGHGISDKGKFLFLPGDTRINANNSLDEKSCLLDSDIVKVLEGQGNRLLFIDACNSGGVDNDRMVHVLQRSNAFVFAASQGHEYSYEDPALGHGYFTDSVMKAIGGDPAALAEGNVSVLSLSGFVRNDVPKRVREKYGKEQNPKLYSLQSADFPMAVIK